MSLREIFLAGTGGGMDGVKTGPSLYSARNAGAKSWRFAEVAGRSSRKSVARMTTSVESRSIGAPFRRGSNSVNGASGRAAESFTTARSVSRTPMERIGGTEEKRLAGR